MNKNILIVLFGAVIVAVLVVVLVQVMVGGAEEPVAPAEEARIEVLVAAKNLKIGAELKAGDLRWQGWPESSLFPGAVRNTGDQAPVDALSGRLSRNISAGEPVMKSALLASDKGNFVAASLEPGMRAMAVDVKAASMVGGFIGPGDYVDVILTYKESIKADNDEDPRIKNMIEMNLNKLAAETILQNVKILAVDQDSKRPEDNKIKIAKTVTLGVSAQDAERLALAADLGELDLILRGVGDDEIVEKKWPTVSDARLTNMADEIFAEYEEMKKDSSIRPDIVRIYDGNAVRVVPAQ